MIAYGWTQEDLHIAEKYVSDLLTEKGGVVVMLNNVEVKSLNCRLGNSTLKFSLSFAGSTAKRKGEYPPGVSYKAWTEGSLVKKQPIPLPEVIDCSQGGFAGSPLFDKGRERIQVERTRGTGSLCWHAFGHFMAKLFDLNPGGRLVTAGGAYDDRRQFRNTAGYNKLQGTHNCTCWENDLADFIHVRGE